MRMRMTGIPDPTGDVGKGLLLLCTSVCIIWSWTLALSSGNNSLHRENVCVSEKSYQK